MGEHQQRYRIAQQVVLRAAFVRARDPLGPGGGLLRKQRAIAYLTGDRTGVLGTILGTRRLGVAAVVVSVVVLLFGLAVFSGLVPGLEAPGYNNQVPEEYE